MTLTSGFSSYGPIQIFSDVYCEGHKACQIGVFNILHNIFPLVESTIFTPEYLPRTIFTVRDPRLAPTPPTLGPILHAESGRCVGETTFAFWELQCFDCLFVCLFVCLPPPVPSYFPATSHPEGCYLKQLKIRTLDTISIFITQPPLRVYAVAWTVKNLCPTKQTSDR